MMMVMMQIVCILIPIMIRVFKRRKSKSQLHLFELQLGNSYIITYFPCVQNSFLFEDSKLSVPKTFPRSKSSITSNFNSTLVATTNAKSNGKWNSKSHAKSVAKTNAKTDAKSDAMPKSKRHAKSDAKLKAKRRSRHGLKQHKYDWTRKVYIDYTPGLLNSLSLPTHYKTKHLLDNLADLPAADLPNYIPDCVCCPEPLLLNTVNIKTTFMPSADVPYFLGIQTMMILATEKGSVKSKEFKLIHQNLLPISIR